MRTRVADEPTNTIKITPTNRVPDIEGINDRLKALILSTEGQLPGSRGFGLAHEYFDKRPREAINLFALELEEKVKKYMPEITIQNVSGTIQEDGIVDVQIFIERNRDYD